MKQKLVTFLIGLFLSMYVSAQTDKPDCQKFKSGTFQFVNDSSELVIVERRNKYQVERNQKTGQVDKFKVRWIDDCTYEIKPFWSSNKLARKNRGATKVIITKVSEDRYDYTCACKTLDNAPSFKGTMIKIK